jgi:hypothetical protein
VVHHVGVDHVEEVERRVVPRRQVERVFDGQFGTGAPVGRNEDGSVHVSGCFTRVR